MSATAWPLGWDDVKPEAFLGFDAREFELFCRELLDIEVHERHAVDAEPEGPPPKHGDGKDLGLRVKSAPLMAATMYASKYTVRPLTADSIGLTVYSCKTGADWRRDALKEARHKSAWAVDALKSGGRFILILSRPVDRDVPSPKAPLKRGKAKSKARPNPSGAAKKLLLELADAYAARTGLSPKTIAERIGVIDANDLQRFVAGRKPGELRLAFRNKLGVDPIPRLLTVETWPAAHEQERGRPEFEWDEARRGIKKAIVQSLGQSDQATTAWIVGAPGVGKTRLVLETLLSDERLSRRTVVALSFEDGRAALAEHRLHERHPDAILVVDDCAPHEVDELLVRALPHNRDGRGRLVVLTPMSPEATAVRPKQGVALVSVLPLEAAALKALIAREIGGPEASAEVAAIARVTEGFPWFAVLIAREVGKGAPLPKSPAEAADLALCSPRMPDFLAQRELLARVLLLAMLTENVDWAHLSDVERTELSKAVGLDGWDQVDKGRRDCVARGLLRLRLGLTFKYVTPAILEREIARKLLAPPPDGPEPLGSRLKQHARRYLSSLFDRLGKLGLDAKTLAELARPIVVDLETGRALAELGREGMSGAELTFAARYQPGPVARALRRRIEAASLEDLRARTDIRRDLVFALASLAGRRAAFEDAEAALFLLALAENEVYGNNATDVWSSLFFVEINATYRTFADKLPLLRRRCTSGGSAERILALHGVGAALTSHGFNWAGEELDGAYPRSTAREAYDARLDAWRLLGQCMRDGDEVVASKARQLVVHELRGAIRTGHIAEVAKILERGADLFDETGRRELLEQVELAEAHDIEQIEQTGGALEWASFTAAVRPHTYADRLRQAVSAFGHLEEREQDHEALAREGLKRPERLVLSEIEWLATPDAVRSTPFLIALGKIDEEHVLVDSLIDFARRGSPDLIACYLRGVQQAERGSVVEAELAKMQADPTLVEAASLTIWRLGATDERVLWLARATREDRVPERVLSMLVLGSWEKNAGDAALESLISALLDRESDTASGVALSLVVHRVKDRGASFERFKPHLVRALGSVAERRLSGMAAHWWELGALLLADTGEVNTALDLVLRVLRQSKDRRGPQEAFAVLRACVSRAPRATWKAVAVELDRNVELGYALMEHGIVSHLRATDVLTWVGRDAGRAERVARMIGMHGSDEMHPIARALIRRFGPEARPARLLGSSVRTSPRAVSSLADFTRAQLARVERWRNDPDPKVRTWAQALHADLEREVELHAAHEEYDRRRWGTGG